MDQGVGLRVDVDRNLGEGDLVQVTRFRVKVRTRFVVGVRVSGLGFTCGSEPGRGLSC